MRFNSTGPSPTLARITITPIIGVALVLVLILLITAPMLAVVDLGVTLPDARSRGAEDDRRITITLSSAGDLAIDDQLVTPDAFLDVLAARIVDASEDVLVVVRADAGTSYGRVRAVLADARSVGARRLAIATHQDTRITS